MPLMVERHADRIRERQGSRDEASAGLFQTIQKGHTGLHCAQSAVEVTSSKSLSISKGVEGCGAWFEVRRSTKRRFFAEHYAASDVEWRVCFSSHSSTADQRYLTDLPIFKNWGVLSPP